MAAKSAALKERTRGNHARGERQHQDARAEGIFHNAPNMVAPGDENEERVNDPDAIFFQELWNGTIIADELLNQIINGGKGTDGAPKAAQKQEDDWDQRPPKHPGQGCSEVVVC